MNGFFEYFERKGVKEIRDISLFVHNFLQDPSIFFDLTGAERDEMEKNWMKPWHSSKIDCLFSDTPALSRRVPKIYEID